MPAKVPRVKLSMGEDEAGEELLSHIREFSITCPWGGRASLAVTLLRSVGKRVSRVQDIFDTVARTHNGSTGNSFTPELTVLEQRSDYPLFVGLSPTSDLETTWGLTDLTALYEKRRLSMRDVISGSGANAHELITQMCGEMGIPSVEINFPNFAVSQIRLNNELFLNALDRVCRVRQAARRWKGSTLILEPYGLSSKSWIYNANNISAFSVQEASPIPPNQFTVSRLERQSGAGSNAEFSCSGGNCVGRSLDVTFDEPVGSYVCTPDYVNQGVLELFQNYDEAGNLINMDPGIGVYAGPIKVKRVTAVYHPQFFGSIMGAPITFTPGYAGTFYVGTRSDPGELGFSFTRPDPEHEPGEADEHQDRYGLIEDEGGIEDPIVRDPEDAEAMCEAVLLESIRKTILATLESPFINPVLREGDFVKVTDAHTGCSSLRFHVESVTVRLTSTGWRQILSLTRTLWPES